jgi:4-hydroxybenzoate polyprenyltransferase
MLLAATWDGSARVVAVVGVAALAGQLTVGWSNDLVDRDRDRLSARRDKPLVTGDVGVAAVRTAIGAAAVVCAVASVSLGARPGALHLALVAMGWAYNLGLKRTVLSWVPYAVCFAGLPVVVSLASRDEPGPWWIVVAGALLGVGAHLVNAVPDLEDDRRAGVVGLPHRLGAARSVDVATALLLAGTVVTVVAPSGGADVAGLAALALCAVLLVAGRLLPGRASFRAAMGIALVDVVALLLRG